MYVGIKSPITGMSSSEFIAVETLLFVIEYNKPVVITSNTSPITGLELQSSPMHQL
jgi:hypothetical protein